LCFQKSPYEAFVFFCAFCVSKKSPYEAFVFFCAFCVSKNLPTRLLFSFVPFVFPKKLLYGFCDVISSGDDDRRYVKPPYGLLCTFVTFVFQKNALRTFVICSATPSGMDDPTYIIINLHRNKQKSRAFALSRCTFPDSFHNFGDTGYLHLIAPYWPVVLSNFPFFCAQ